MNFNQYLRPRGTSAKRKDHKTSSVIICIGGTIKRYTGVSKNVELPLCANAILLGSLLSIPFRRHRFLDKEKGCTTESRSEVSKGVGRVLNSGCNIPVLDQASTDHPPDICNDTYTLHAGDALEVCHGEVRPGSVGADEDILDLDGARREEFTEGLDS